jgi:hypothetical protein
VPAGAEVVRDRAEGREELLGVRRRFEALEHPFSSPRRPVRVLDGVVATRSGSLAVLTADEPL